MDEQVKIRIDELVFKSLEGIISEAEYAEFESLLRSDSQVLRYYASSIDFNLGMQKLGACMTTPLQMEMVLQELATYEKIAPEIDLPTAQAQPELVQKVIYPPREKRRFSKFSIFTLVNVAAVLLFFVFLRFSPFGSGVEVATLTDSMGAKWADPGHSIQVGTRLVDASEKFMLREGVAELTFDNDARIIIEAPSEFQILADDRIGLTYGKVYATVPPNAIGFSVYTQNTKIIDLGTEFGVMAETTGDTQLYVLKGKTSLIAGGESGKTSMEVTKNTAKRISGVTQEISNIPPNNHLFIRDIDSSLNFVWHGQTEIDLADMVGGGTGFGGGTQNAGIEVATGKIISNLLSDKVTVGSSGYQTVTSNPFIDGVFVPGLEDVTAVTADQSLSVAFPQTSGSYWGYIMNGAFHQGEAVGRHTLRLNGMLFGTPENPAIAVHSNQGITFDLSKIRETIPNVDIKTFRSLLGISETVAAWEERSAADFRIFLDGNEVYANQVTSSEKAVEVDIPIADGDRYLTLAVTEADNTCAFDWTLFGRPRLLIEPTEESD